MKKKNSNTVPVAAYPYYATNFDIIFESTPCKTEKKRGEQER